LYLISDVTITVLAIPLHPHFDVANFAAYVALYSHCRPSLHFVEYQQK